MNRDEKINFCMESAKKHGKDLASFEDYDVLTDEELGLCVQWFRILNLLSN